MKKEFITGHMALWAFFVAVILGSFAYSYVEGWNYLDSLYFVVVTVTTIGYGDFAPVTDAGKLFTIFYAFFGVATGLYLLGAVGSSMFKQHLAIKITEIKEAAQKKEEAAKQLKKVQKKVSKKH